MQVETLTIDDSRWPAILRCLAHDYYHEPAYVRVDARRMQATPEALLIHDGEQVFFVPYLLRSCSSLFPEINEPLYDVVSPYGYPGILISEAGHNPAFVAKSLSAF